MCLYKPNHVADFESIYDDIIKNQLLFIEHNLYKVQGVYIS